MSEKSKMCIAIGRGGYKSLDRIKDASGADGYWKMWNKGKETD